MIGGSRARTLFSRSSVSLLAVACAAVVASCGMPGGVEQADNCKMPELAPGEIPSPEEILPPPEECPELYEGSGSGSSVGVPEGPGISPPTGGGPGVDPGGPEI